MSPTMYLAILEFVLIALREIRNRGNRLVDAASFVDVVCQYGAWLGVDGEDVRYVLRISVERKMGGFIEAIDKGIEVG